MVLPAPQVGQANSPVGSQAEADRSPELIVDHHLRLMFLSGYIVEGDALDARDEGLQFGKTRIVGHASRRVRNPDPHPTHDLSQRGALGEWIVLRTRTQMVLEQLYLDGADEIK